MRVAQLGRHQTATLDMDFQAVQECGDILQRFVSTIQTFQPARMILFVQALGTQQQMKISQRTMNFATPDVRDIRRNVRNKPCEGARRMPRIRACPRLRLRAAVVLLGRQYGPQYQIVPHLLPFRLRDRFATAGESAWASRRLS